MEKNLVCIEISLDLFKKIEDRIQKTEFKSVSEYVSFVLAEVVKEDDEKEERGGLTAEEEALLTDRLRGLGYL